MKAWLVRDGLDGVLGLKMVPEHPDENDFLQQARTRGIDVTDQEWVVPDGAGAEKHEDYEKVVSVTLTLGGW